MKKGLNWNMNEYSLDLEVNNTQKNRRKEGRLHSWIKGGPVCRQNNAEYARSWPVSVAARSKA